jgi:Zn finger protein HypA/HybF involved in hydrogenase expression
VHELGLCTDVVEAVERRAAGRRVARVRVRVGEAHAVEPEAFEQSFAIAAAGSVAEGAWAELVLVGGDELVLEEIEYELAGSSEEEGNVPRHSG